MLISSFGLYFRIKVQTKRMGLSNEDLEPPADDPEFKPDEEKGSTSKEKRKSFSELGPEMKKLRMKPLDDHVKGEICLKVKFPLVSTLITFEFSRKIT